MEATNFKRITQGMNLEPLFFFFVPCRKMIYFPDCYTQLTLQSASLSNETNYPRAGPLLRALVYCPSNSKNCSPALVFPMQNSPHILPTGLNNFLFQGQIKKHKKKNQPQKQSFIRETRSVRYPPWHISSLP